MKKKTQYMGFAKVGRIGTSRMYRGGLGCVGICLTFRDDAGDRVAQVELTPALAEQLRNELGENLISAGHQPITNSQPDSDPDYLDRVMPALRAALNADEK